MMRSRPRWLAGCGVALVVGGLAAWLAAPSAPSFEGRTLDAWIDHYALAASRRIDPWEVEVSRARDAIRAMEKEALPILLDDLAARRAPTWFDTCRGWLARPFRSARLQPRRIEDRWNRAVRGLEALGTNASLALPRLIAQATQNPPYSLRALMAVGEPAMPAIARQLATSPPAEAQQWVEALGDAIGSQRLRPEAATIAVPPILALFRSTNGIARASAAGVLVNLHQRPDLCLPAFLESFGDPDPNIRRLSAVAMASFGDAAGAYVPRLLRLYESGDAATRATACTALGWIRAPATETVPTLLRGSRDADASVRAAAIAGMGHVPTATNLTLPAIAVGLEAPDLRVRGAAVHACRTLGSHAISCEPILRRLAEDSEEPLQEAAAYARRKVLGLPAGIPPRKLARPLPPTQSGGSGSLNPSPAQSPPDRAAPDA